MELRYSLRRRREQLTVARDNIGIVIVDFGTELITIERVKEAHRQHLDLQPTGPESLMVFGDAGTGLAKEIVDFTASPEMAQVVKAMALVAETKAAFGLANIFLKVARTPYPLKLFRNETDAGAWLESFLL